MELGKCSPGALRLKSNYTEQSLREMRYFLPTEWLHSEEHKNTSTPPHTSAQSLHSVYRVDLRAQSLLIIHERQTAVTGEMGRKNSVVKVELITGMRLHF